MLYSRQKSIGMPYIMLITLEVAAMIISPALAMMVSCFAVLAWFGWKTQIRYARAI